MENFIGDELIYNELYQLKDDVGMLNTVKIYWADVFSVSRSSEQKWSHCFTRFADADQR